MLTLEPDGAITNWLGDAQGSSAIRATKRCANALADLFMEADRAAGVPAAEIEAALGSGRAEDSRWHPAQERNARFWANGVTMRLTEGSDTLVKVFRDETPPKLADQHRERCTSTSSTTGSRTRSSPCRR